MGRKSKEGGYIDTYTRVADSLCCSVEIDTTLYSNYTPRKEFDFVSFPYQTMGTVFIMEISSFSVI